MAPPILKRTLQRIVVFLILFILVSGIIGPWVISTKLLYGFSFFIYGNLGKMVLVSTIAFVLYERESLQKIKIPPYNKKNLLYVFLSFLLIPVFFLTAQSLLRQPTMYANIPLLLITHILLILIPILLIPGVFGTAFIRTFIREYKKQILIAVAMGVLFDISIFYVWKLWPIFSTMVLHAVYFLLSLTFKEVYIVPPFGIFLTNFVVFIEEACSGVDSLYLFSLLYLLLAFLDWRKFNKKKLLLMFVPSIIGLFAVNILRVYVLILAGVLVSPELTVTLFHTYIGMIFFIIYFILFWRFLYAWMKE
jgi:exosortase/archaeosortase family protein